MIEGGDEFAAAIERLTSRVASAAEAAVTKTALDLESRARRNASARPGPNVQTGMLRRSIRAHPTVRAGDVFTAKVGVSAIYARIQELGGTVRPVRARMLSWVGPDGTRRYARSVRIPARPYFKPAFLETYGRYRDVLVEHVAEAVG